MDEPAKFPIDKPTMQAMLAALKPEWQIAQRQDLRIEDVVMLIADAGSPMHASMLRAETATVGDRTVGMLPRDLYAETYGDTKAGAMSAALKAAGCLTVVHDAANGVVTCALLGVATVASAAIDSQRTEFTPQTVVSARGAAGTSITPARPRMGRNARSQKPRGWRR